MKIPNLLILSSLLFSSEVIASPIYSNISREYNLIGFPYLMVQEVIGDKSKYEIIPTASKELMLIPKAKLGERLDIILITTTGYSQQLYLTVKDIAPSHFIIPVPLPHNLLALPIKTQDEQVKEFLEEILANRVQLEPIKSTGYIQIFDNLKLKLIGTFTRGNLKGELYEAKNINSKTITVDVQSLKVITPNSLMVYMPQNVLEPRKNTQLLLITKMQ